MEPLVCTVLLHWVRRNSFKLRRATMSTCEAVYNAQELFEATGGHGRRAGNATRPCSTRTEGLLGQVQAQIEENVVMSVRGLARNFSVRMS